MGEHEAIVISGLIGPAWTLSPTLRQPAISIAHSRGTDVAAATGLRELLIESRGAQSALRADFWITESMIYQLLW